MREETKLALTQAGRRLKNARKMLAAEMPDEAVDTAYNVYLRTMEAYLYELGQTPPKDHGRTRVNFLAASSKDDRIPDFYVEKITDAARLKNANDYGVEAYFITHDEAIEVVALADKFFHTVKNIVDPPSPVSTPKAGL